MGHPRPGALPRLSLRLGILQEGAANYPVSGMLQKATNAYSELSRQKSGFIFGSSADAQGADSYQNKSKKNKTCAFPSPSAPPGAASAAPCTSAKAWCAGRPSFHDLPRHGHHLVAHRPARCRQNHPGPAQPHGGLFLHGLHQVRLPQRQRHHHQESSKLIATSACCISARGQKHVKKADHDHCQYQHP